MWLLAAFIGIPLIEIGLFIQVGGLIGLWPTLLIVVVTAIIGTAMVRSQGIAALANIQGALDRFDNPAEPLAHGAMILVSGVLLLTPGFFTDALGFALLVPAVRERVFAALRRRITVQQARAGGADGTQQHRHGYARDRSAPGGGPGVIDGEFHEIDPDSLPPRRTDTPSGWTRGEG
ncbi:exclusion protein FxsA [Meridianimarinicoccus roseus]|uniref:Exclusion protein FxsA n=1 Tax=Meridianimarinicoccus roseus TaxID=2072018 RepID=A0A2V2LMD0_9RHOB|nr:FxsA family protein [Meridianimarinicoccus roseus]PWR02893.1 exclusion protein FxsA [Meridianimarinicoccus roseus]